MKIQTLHRVTTKTWFTAALGVAALLAPYAAHGIPPSDPYADAVYSTSGGVTTNNAQNAVGAPDGTTTTMVSANGSLTLDMGAGEEGLDTLRVYFGNLTLGANIRVDFLNSNLGTITSSQSTLTAEAGTSTKDFAFNYDQFNVAYRYVRFTSLADGVFGLDAVEALDFGTPTVSRTPRVTVTATVTVSPAATVSPAVTAGATPGSGTGSGTGSGSGSGSGPGFPETGDEGDGDELASGSMGFLEDQYAKLKAHGFCWESLLLAVLILIMTSILFRDALRRKSGAGKFLWVFIYLLGALLFCLISLLWSIVWTLGFPLLVLIFYLSWSKTNHMDPHTGLPKPGATTGVV